MNAYYNESGRGLFWLSLLISVIALVLAIASYNQSDKRIDQRVEEKIKTVTEDTKNSLQRLAEKEALRIAAQDLTSIRGDVESNRDQEATSKKLVSVRDDLKKLQANSSGPLKDNLNKIDQNLAKLINEVGTGSTEATATLDQTVDMIQTTMRTIK